MKNALIIILALASFSCTSVRTTDSWGVLEYHYGSGPIAPPYQYEYNIIINSDGNCHFRYSFPMEGENNLEYKFNVSPAQIKSLNETIVKSKILEKKIPSLPEDKIPLGGSVKKVKIVVPNPNPNLDQPPKVFESPYFPEEKYKQGLDELYKLIVSFVPESITKDAEQKREDYINKAKN